MGKDNTEPEELFGTDGIRGKANLYPMTAEVALKVGMAAGKIFTRGAHRHRVVIGKDTRLSGYMFEPALVAGFTSVGMDAIFFGPLPTPAVAMLTRSLRADLGVMITASHNAYEDNGIKLFGPDGYKLSDSVEHEIEAIVSKGTSHLAAAPENLGRAKRIEDAQARYIEFAKATFPRRMRLDGIKIVIDCANGAAWRVAPAVLYELGADVIPIGVEPDGFNINKGCGSTDTALMCETVRQEGADLGIALDGDADRVLIADETGKLIDGDQLMALIGKSWSQTDRLSAGGIVTTVMSNLGLEKYIEGLGLTMARTAVGDRSVVKHMREHGFNVGGEQSGHIVLSDFATTGDGLIAALQLLEVLKKSGQKVSEACHLFEPYPQYLQNVRYNGGAPLEDKSVKLAIEAGEEKLKASGRLLIRKSGTEPLIRVMGEGEDEAIVKSVVGDICEAIETVAG